MEQKNFDISLQNCSPEVLQIAINFSTDFLAYMENVPFDLQKKVTKLREVDQKCREHVGEIESLYDKFISYKDGTGCVKQRMCLGKIRQLFALCKELGDEKIAIVQSISEVLEVKNKQLDLQSKRFLYAYEPNMKQDLSGKIEKEAKSDSTRGRKRSQRHRNNQNHERQDKLANINKEDRVAKDSYLDEDDEPPAKISSSHSSTIVSSPAHTRAAQRDEDKRSVTKYSRDKKDDKSEKREEDSLYIPPSSAKIVSDLSTSSSSMLSISSTISSSVHSNKQSTSIVSNSSSPSTNNKNTLKGKKKKRKSNKYQTERQASTGNSGAASPFDPMPVDPDEPTYCICQQVSFGQMIGCDNPKCPIEWFHFSCLRLSHKPKGKWYCPDCTIKMKEKKRESKREHK